MKKVTGKPKPKKAVLSFRQSETKDEAFLLETTKQLMGKVFEDSTGSPLTETFIRQQLASNETTMIIERAGKPIGYFNYSMYTPNRLYWGALLLLPTVQAKGIGKKMVQHMEKLALEKGAVAIDGHVQISNTRAILFWLKNGFQVKGMPFRGVLSIEKPVPKR